MKLVTKGLAVAWVVTLVGVAVAFAFSAIPYVTAALQSPTTYGAEGNWWLVVSLFLNCGFFAILCGTFAERTWREQRLLRRRP